MKAACEPIRILIVDDHRLVAEALRGVLDRQSGMAVIGTLSGMAELATWREVPHVILMDYVLVDGTGAEATRLAKARWPRARVVMVTSVGADETILETVQAGADGYLTKDRALREVVDAVRAVHAGQVLLPPPLLQTIAQRLADITPEAPLPCHLTARELEVLRCLAHGRSTASIGLELGLSPATVRTHVQAIRTKLGAHSKLEAVAVAVSRGLITRQSGVAHPH